MDCLARVRVVFTESENLVRPFVSGIPGYDCRKIPYESRRFDLVEFILVIDRLTIICRGSEVWGEKGTTFCSRDFSLASRMTSSSD